MELSIKTVVIETHPELRYTVSVEFLPDLPGETTYTVSSPHPPFPIVTMAIWASMIFSSHIANVISGSGVCCENIMQKRYTNDITL